MGRHKIANVDYVLIETWWSIIKEKNAANCRKKSIRLETTGLERWSTKCMHNPKSVPENEMHKVLWDFDIKTDLLISARRPNQELVNKKESNCRILDIAVPADNEVKVKESDKNDKYELEVIFLYTVKCFLREVPVV